MQVKSDPTMGWRSRDLAQIILLVTARQKKEMAQRVAQARDAKGMTNESLARKSGLSVKTVSRFVNGKHEPREHTIESLAKPLGMTTAEIRGMRPAPLGLGAREDQVEDIREEFRVDVDKIKDGLAENRRLLAVLLEKLAPAEFANYLEQLADQPAPAAGQPSKPARTEDGRDSQKTA